MGSPRAANCRRAVDLAAVVVPNRRRDALSLQSADELPLVAGSKAVHFEGRSGGRTLGFRDFCGEAINGR